MYKNHSTVILSKLVWAMFISITGYVHAQPSTGTSTNNMQLLGAHCKAQLADRAQQADPSDGLALPLRPFYRFYRNSLSEQFASDCSFELSCSRFAKSSISRFGIFKGGLMGIDRLMRCHSFVALETVPVLFNNQTGKVIDDPSMY